MQALNQQQIQAAVTQVSAELLDVWMKKAQGDKQQLARILLDTARIRGWTQAQDIDTVWLDDHKQAPLWAAKSALFLLLQMPKVCLQPENDSQVWGYAYLIKQIYTDFAEVPEKAQAWPNLQFCMQSIQAHQRII
ncbi:hypothetical protein SAMN05421831_102254 [Allopseudospirillum japonicum]|uniref:Uncharacterized protein n=1 Tax=Allopseudospirillum japonicum TaxID=64971 RepID=A0A1H6R9H6_9GAMM|nr:hypothetical protein [Allopseudospirillum japonicum]SEI47832.1 hypothetical protein SAMN05421831_102254 [Allopseudospirillum japonicum]